MNTVHITRQLLAKKIRPISRDAHKGINGTLNIVAGSKKFRGAADLCVSGALRSGCGIVRLISDEPVIAAVAARHPSCTFLPIKNDEDLHSAFSSALGDVFAIGCGLGKDSSARKRLIFALDASKRSVLDADALNIIAESPDLYAKLENSIITPHVLEFSRLSGRTPKEIKESSLTCALEFSKKHGCVTVLKDAKTVIATKSSATYVSEGASCGLSKGGSGDVLCGIIAGFLAQGYSPEDAAVIGVGVHALASQLCAREMGIHSMLPSDLEIYIARLFSSLKL